MYYYVIDTAGRVLDKNKQFNTYYVEYAYRFPTIEEAEEARMYYGGYEIHSRYGDCSDTYGMQEEAIAVLFTVPRTATARGYDVEYKLADGYSVDASDLKD